MTVLIGYIYMYVLESTCFFRLLCNLATDLTSTKISNVKFTQLCLISQNFVRGVIVTLGALLHVVAVMLSHAHVPRYELVIITYRYDGKNGPWVA